MEINADLIRQYIWNNKLTRAEFCKMCGISTATLRKIFKMEYDFKFDALLKIAKVMNIGLKQLFIIYN